MNFLSVPFAILLEINMLYDLIFLEKCPFICLLQIRYIWNIPDTNDLENYGQGHKASLSIQMN